jgi:succinoglycan biosynthesis transport protein ExoP
MARYEQQSSSHVDGSSGSVLAALRRRLPIIIITAVLVTAAVTAFAYRSRNNYQSSAQLLFGQTVGPELNALGLLPVAVDAASQAANDTALVASRDVAARTAQTLGPGFSRTSVQNDVVVTPAKSGQVVTVTATRHSGQGAATLANVYAEAARRVVNATVTRHAQDAAAAMLAQYRGLAYRDRHSGVGGALLIRVAQLRALSQVGTSSPSIIQTAYAPTSPSGSIAQFVALGAALGLLLGAGLALLREQADQRLRHTGAVAAAFDAPVLATLPRNRALARRRPFAKLPAGTVEALQMLQVNLRYGHGHPLRSVIVTSSGPREGKTTVAWNLCLAAASSGLSVALIDADLRRSRLASGYHLQPSPGLSEVLDGQVGVADAIQTVTLDPQAATNGDDPPLATVDVLVAGVTTSDPSRMLQSSQMTGMLEAMQRQYDLVVVDTPPIARVADAIALLRSVDGVVVVASVNRLREGDAQSLRNQLQGLGANVIGVVANGGTGSSSYAFPRRQPQPL